MVEKSRKKEKQKANVEPTTKKRPSPKKTSKPRNSEFRAYPWIEKRLQLKGWNVANPNTNPSGEVWTQQECLDDPLIRQGLGKQRPENVVKISSNEFWIIEAKSEEKQLALACDEAKKYADCINSNSIASAPIATGVAGNPETGFVSRHFIKLDGKWRQIKLGNHLLEGFSTKQEINRLLAQKTANLSRDELSLKELVALSKFINEQLHVAKISKENRSVVVAQLLLALHEDPSLTMKDPAIFLQDLTSRSERIFKSAGKKDLWEEVKIGFPEERIVATAAALSRIIQELRAVDVVDSIGKADILGPFFESFLRYGNTSKDLGIVLTPRHICWFAAEALAVDANDTIYDPAAGTAGFLVAAFNRVKSLVDIKRAKMFAEKNIYGAETDAKVASLAFINMFFRGDGKHNLSFRSCFERVLASKGKQLTFIEKKTETHATKKTAQNGFVTKVLMNPPFALKDAKEKEPHFIDHGLSQMVEGGLLFAIVPASVFYEKKYSSWRERLLESNTLIASVSFPIDLFYPVATHSIAVVIRKGRPHNESDVLWARIIDDGYEKKKGYRIEKANHSYKDVLGELAESIREWAFSGRKLHKCTGRIEFLPISSAELIPQAHLGTDEMKEDEFVQNVNLLTKGIIVQQWEQQERKGIHK